MGRVRTVVAARSELLCGRNAVEVDAGAPVYSPEREKQAVATQVVGVGSRQLEVLVCSSRD